MKEVDVLIIGAGPTGGMLALELAMQNVSFRIIDSAPVRSDKSRALVLHSRSLELLNRHGLVQELIPLGQLAQGVKVFANKRLAGEIDIQTIRYDDTAFQTPLMISQADTEHFLDKALLRYGKTVERPLTATKVEQDDEGVTATLSRPDGTEEQVRSRFVVGCDGAHSIVRKAAGLDFGGGAYPQDFILADAHVKWEHPYDRLSVFLGYGVLVSFPLKDGVLRLICIRPHQAKGDAEPTLQDFRDIMAEMVPGPCELSDPVWISRFRLHHRNVEKYSLGRLFLAGDAAHIHSPAGGQGMNTGIQDAANLGWKLARVIRGEKGPQLLDSYQLERHKIGEYLLRGTDRLFEFMATSNWLVRFLRNTLVPWVFPWIFRNRDSTARRFRFITQLGIRYRDSPIVGAASTYKGTLRGGDRAPDGALQGADGETTLLGLCTGPTHHLILFSGTGSGAMTEEALQSVAADFLGDDNGGWVKAHVVVSPPLENKSCFLDSDGKLHARFGIAVPSYVLVRPDGYIAYIGPQTAMDELKAWVKT